MARLDDNLEILRRLETLLREQPDLRFAQALLNIGVVVQANTDRLAWADTFHEEPKKTLQRMDAVASTQRQR